MLNTAICFEHNTVHIFTLTVNPSDRMAPGGFIYLLTGTTSSMFVLPPAECLGPKFSGKSAELMRQLDRYLQTGRPAIMIKPSIEKNGTVEKSSVPIGYVFSLNRTINHFLVHVEDRLHY